MHLQDLLFAWVVRLRDVDRVAGCRHDVHADGLRFRSVVGTAGHRVAEGEKPKVGGTDTTAGHLVKKLGNSDEDAPATNRGESPARQTLECYLKLSDGALFRKLNLPENIVLSEPVYGHQGGSGIFGRETPPVGARRNPTISGDSGQQNLPYPRSVKLRITSRHVPTYPDQGHGEVLGNPLPEPQFPHPLQPPSAGLRSIVKQDVPNVNGQNDP
ncbi:MAG: hypothetical protein BJ554DRAFT_5750 [Olpidium bornovanus]|uniref:Uncharacterized protein n=1 Tax=Olpidium bornovanus TaxID=278681 RepID=A0A8H8DL97_9FUNG|nr:MAG: hypothetical protein BJ554DRAFT_5750 [Olpidium bornovanus]